MRLRLSLLSLWLTATTHAQSPGSFVQVGDTVVSAMMMFLGNAQKVYILDKTEGNAASINGHPAWGSVWDIQSNSATAMDVYSNTFCASGMHLPNGSYVTFGGNGAIGPMGVVGSQPEPNAGRAAWDATYKDYDGTKAIRVLNPCTGPNSNLVSNPQCGWWEDATVLAMQKSRWYAAAEPLADGTVVVIGGFVNGGYINRNYPNTDPELEGGAAEPTYEFYPPQAAAPQVFNFMIKTSGLNSYAHTFLMPSGKMFVQANVSTTLWDPYGNVETPLPDMPGNVVRVYPGSGATAMLPLTPANNYNPTILFCGGNNMPEQAWGNYSWPFVNTWEQPASNDCQRITPEPQDGSSPVYVQDDNMLEARTMGQFIALPDGKMLVLNGGLNGTAGYATQTLLTLSYSLMPHGMSLASGPVGTPRIYDPEAPTGSRWSSSGLSTSNIPRLYHSSAILLPDASVLVAGSNPNVDVNLTTDFPTTYKAEVFYPSYFSSSRPVPSGIPNVLSYGGSYFDISVPSSSYSGAANTAAGNAKIMVIRPGFTTHAMNMGQRSLQLNHTYTVQSNGSIQFHVSQMPPNANIFQPGPALLFVTINGIPSNGTYVTVGSGRIEKQTMNAVSTLPASVGNNVSGSSPPGGNNTPAKSGGVSLSGGAIGGIVGAIVAVVILGAIFGILIARRRRATARKRTSGAYAETSSSVGGAGPRAFSKAEKSDSSSLVPLQPSNTINYPGTSSVNLESPSTPYLNTREGRSADFDSFTDYQPPLMTTGAGPPQYQSISSSYQSHG